jgi:hypothetical protein
MRIVHSLQVDLAPGMRKQEEKQTSKIVPKVPRGLRVLPGRGESVGARSEYDDLLAGAAKIDVWWTSPRWQHTKRVYSGKTVYGDQWSYRKLCLRSKMGDKACVAFSFHISSLLFPSAMDVASLRPSKEARSNAFLAPNSSFSDDQARKLFQLLKRLQKAGGYSHTFGALDPVQAVQMAPHLSSVYVSGWQCSSTASSTNEPGPDFAGRFICKSFQSLSLFSYPVSLYFCFPIRSQTIP